MGPDVALALMLIATLAPAHLLWIAVERKIDFAAAPVDGDVGTVVRARRGLLGGVRVPDPDLAAVLVYLCGPPSDVAAAAGQRDAQVLARLPSLWAGHVSGVIAGCSGANEDTPWLRLCGGMASTAHFALLASVGRVLLVAAHFRG